jgi:hypothetical protein
MVTSSGSLTSDYIKQLITLNIDYITFDWILVSCVVVEQRKCFGIRFVLEEPKTRIRKVLDLMKQPTLEDHPQGCCCCCCCCCCCYCCNFDISYITS